MDGNLRWAKKNNLTAKDGYLKGLNKINEVIDLCIKEKIKYLTLYALSTENKKRNSINVIYKIINYNFHNIFDELTENKKVKIKVIGERNNLPKNIINILEELEDRTRNNKILNLNIAFNYGTNFEILNIVKIIAENFKKEKIKINDATIKKNMYLGNIPDPDILIRTGGYKRLSNFLLMNLSYTELFFLKTLWPDLSKKEILKIFNKYKNINRKYGL